MRSQGAYFEGVCDVIVLCTMFLVSYMFFNKRLYFSYSMSGYLLDRPRTFLNFPPLSFPWGFGREWRSIAYRHTGHTFDQTLDLHEG